MNTNHRLRKDCRLCRSSEVEKVVALAATPPANQLLESQQSAQAQQKYPLDLYLCHRCRHLQLLDVVSPELLYSHYLYVSGTAPSFREHFQQYAAQIIADYSIPVNSLVVDIGSNDGTLLSAFRNSGMRIQGVDPAIEIAAKANTNGIDTIVDFFTTETAAQIKSEKGHAKLVVANNVFAHIDNLEAVLSAVEIVLDPDGIIVIEVSYLKDVIEKTLFDTIYHEHLDYHSVRPLQSFFHRNHFEIIDVMGIESHGGSIRVVVQRESGSCAENPSVSSFIAAEDAIGLFNADTFRSFEKKISKLGRELQHLLHSIKAEGKSICAYGLPAKATTLMHQFKIGPDIIDYVVDDSPLKQGLFSPGYGIEIVGSERLEIDKPDCVIVLAWNFAQPIIEYLDPFLEEGGTIIVPLPKIKIVTKNDKTLS